MWSVSYFPKHGGAADDRVSDFVIGLHCDVIAGGGKEGDTTMSCSGGGAIGRSQGVMVVVRLGKEHWVMFTKAAQRWIAEVVRRSVGCGSVTRFEVEDGLQQNGVVVRPCVAALGARSGGRTAP
ncbi:formate/nitrite transporter family protein [Sesbania bispinosa]|nr:formate/nitrite transporter family protein [Sesbania bispinosa]